METTMHKITEFTTAGVSANGQYKNFMESDVCNIQHLTQLCCTLAEQNQVRKL